MNVVEGKYNNAVVYTDLVEVEALSQIKQMCDQEFVKDSHIAIMPDVHAGAGCTIGTTMTIKDKVCPNLVGVDIGCGMYVIGFNKHSDFVRKFSAPKFDEVVRKVVPAGKQIFDEPCAYALDSGIKDKLTSIKAEINVDRAMMSIGTLGGGNHFIEVDKDDENNLYIVVHTGSRHLGLEVCGYYMEQAKKQCCGKLPYQINEVITKLKSEGRSNEIQEALQRIRDTQPSIPTGLEYVSGHLFDDYIHDMAIAQEFALLSRHTIMHNILKALRVKDTSIVDFTTIHNYIDIEHMVLRKGAVSAMEGERLIIPMNMRDGSLICIGKGNRTWNCSAPHGAGRLMSRGKARESITLDKFRRSMDGIYTTSVCKETIDESPFAYKPMQSIIDNIGDTVEIERIIKPIYNFKATE